LVSAIANKVATGVQPGGRALPQLIPNGLLPAEHLRVAMSVQHPSVRAPPLTPACQYALRHGQCSEEELVSRRCRLLSVLNRLSTLSLPENARLLRLIHPFIAPVVSRRNLALMREISRTTGTADFAFRIDYACGMPMLGWASASPSHLFRRSEPQCSVDELMATTAEHNQQMVARTRASPIEGLDDLAWAKTQEEVALDMVTPPMRSLEQLMRTYGFGRVRLCRRFGIVERHGGALEDSGRVIDDLKEGGQNFTTASLWTHRPADLDLWGA